MSKFKNINLPLNLNSKEETMLELWKKWSIRCYTEEDALRNTLNEYQKIKEDAARDLYWGKAADFEWEKGDTADLERQPTPTWNREDLTDPEISLMEYYVNYTKWLEGHPLTHKWNRLKTNRSEAWSNFLEEVDTNWLQVIKYEEKLNRRLFLLEKEGKTPSPEAWDKAMNVLSRLKGDVVKYYTNDYGEEAVDYKGFQGETWTSKRNHITFPLFILAQEATKECSNFWWTKEGKELTELKEKRASLWNSLCELGLQTRFWELSSGPELNMFFTWGEVTEDVDSFGSTESDRKEDVDPTLWWQIAGLPTSDHYHVCIYDTGDKSPVSEDALNEYYTSARKEEDMIMDEIDNLILEESWSLEDEEEYQESLELLVDLPGHEPRESEIQK